MLAGLLCPVGPRESLPVARIEILVYTVSYEQQAQSVCGPGFLPRLISSVFSLPRTCLCCPFAILLLVGVPGMPETSTQARVLVGQQQKLYAPHEWPQSSARVPDLVCLAHDTALFLLPGPRRSPVAHPGPSR